jgi:hypothetical protein
VSALASENVERYLRLGKRLADVIDAHAAIEKRNSHQLGYIGLAKFSSVEWTPKRAIMSAKLRP